ncbi:MAG: hypothetical protein AVDCRST_MAG33-1913, partial [uncultured Thermomicrobiales bacterium]
CTAPTSRHGGRRPPQPGAGWNRSRWPSTRPVRRGWIARPARSDTHHADNTDDN